MAILASERRFSWGAAWAGLFTVAAMQVLMQLFGLAVGFSVVSPTRGTVHGVNIWMGIWAIISTLSAFFFAAWATFGTVLLSLGCSAAGSVLGAGRREREVVERRPIVTTPEEQL